MSRTPEKVRNKGAESFQSGLYGIGALFLLVAFGAFQNEGSEGTGLLLGLVGGVLIWGGAKIRTTYDKVGERGIYR